jgi:hypothetical protein
MPHSESHRSSRIGWLRASVLGANDGIVSTASLVLGVAASGATPSVILVTGAAALVAGAMSMAAGEYVSVSAQADAEAADRARETRELQADPATELNELTEIYQRRGIDAALARQVAEQLTARDALAAHLRDELGQTAGTRARPVQAANRPGGGVLGRRDCSARGGMVVPDETHRRRGGDHFTRHARRPRRARGQGRWLGHLAPDRSRHVLGCARHGGHECGRCAVRRQRVIRSPVVPARTALSFA